MAGEISLTQLKADREKAEREKTKIKKADAIFLDFLEYAGTSVEPWRPPDFLRVCRLETPPPPEVKRAPVGAEG